MAVWDSFAAENKTMVMEQIVKNKRFSDALLILWAGGAALLSYSLVYALRKPYTAASFEGFDFFGTDYKVAVTTIQILAYIIHSGFISGYQNRYGDNLKPPTNVYHRMTA